MTISVRSVLMAGVTTLTVAAVAAAPSVQPAPPPRPEPAAAVQLTAQTQPQLDRAELTAWLAAAQRRAPNSVVSDSLVADQQAAPTAALVAFPGIGNAIIGIYNLVIPWVDYGVELAQYVVGFIPFGYLIGDQIGIFYFQLIRPIATSITFNIADFIGGSTSFVQGVINVIDDSIAAGINFGIAEINWGLSLIGLPPLPPLPFAAAQQASTVAVAATESTLTEPGEAAAPRRPIRAITTAVGELTKIFTPQKAGEEAGVDAITAVPEIDPGNTNVTRSLMATPRAVAKGVVRAQGEVRGAIRDAVTAVADAAEPEERGAAPEPVAKRVRDSGRQLAGSIRKVANDVRDTVRSARDTKKAETADE